MGRKRRSVQSPQDSVEKHAKQNNDPLSLAQHILRQHIAQSSMPTVVHGFAKEKEQLQETIVRAATAGESNSVLLIGPRGSGKTMLLKCVLDDLNENSAVQQNLLQVKLNGLLQTDDRIALQEITRQLQLENTVGDRVFGSFAETLQFLLEALKSGGHGSKTILFVLEEFDLFAQHRNQTLLYNLFDIAQSAQTPICVIGVTCRLDVMELLEKRVKSRFSHRQLHLFRELTFKDYCQVCCRMLQLPTTFPDKKFAEKWNKNMEKLMEEATVKDVLRQHFSHSTDIRSLQSLLVHPVCHLSTSHPDITAADFVDSLKVLFTDTKASMLHGISILELCLIIAMKHLSDIYDGEPFNFEMVYSEYLKFAQRRSSMQVFEKSVVLKAYEHLMALELIRPLEGSSSRVQKEYRLMTMLVHPSQITEALQKYPSCPTDIKYWAASALV